MKDKLWKDLISYSLTLYYVVLTCITLQSTDWVSNPHHSVPDDNDNLQMSQVKVSLTTITRMRAKQSDALLINIHNLNSHISPENMIISKDFIEKYSNKTPKPVFFQCD